GASRSNFAWPNTTSPSMVSLTTAGLHRSPLDVAVPVHSPSYGPAAAALLNCDRSSKKVAVATVCAEFMGNSHCLRHFTVVSWHTCRRPCTCRSTARVPLRDKRGGRPGTREARLDQPQHESNARPSAAFLGLGPVAVDDFGCVSGA